MHSCCISFSLTMGKTFMGKTDIRLAGAHPRQIYYVSLKTDSNCLFCTTEFRPCIFTLHKKGCPYGVLCYTVCLWENVCVKESCVFSSYISNWYACTVIIYLVLFLIHACSCGHWSFEYTVQDSDMKQKGCISWIYLLLLPVNQSYYSILTGTGLC